MRRFFTSLLLMMALSISAWAGILYFPQPIVDFPIGGDQPETRTENGTTYNYYCQHVWWYNNDDMSDTPIALDSWQINDFLWSVDVTGNIEIPQSHYANYDGDSHYELNGPWIYFTGSEGTITLTATNPDYQGIPYSASYTINYHTFTLGETSHLWDFYSERLAIGRSSDNDSELRNGTLWKRIDMSNGHPESPDIFVWTFSNIDRGSEQYFNQYYGRDHHIIEEANGLQFLATKDNIGIYNENDSATAVSDRFLAINKGSSLIIPSSYFENYKNPRVRIKMAKYGENITLTVNNAYDALGTEITTDYVIGGSAFWGGKGDWHYRGEYHFQIKNKNQEFKIDVKNGEWLLLYLIEVYDQEEIKSENTVLGTCYQFLNTNTTTTPASGKFYLHYRGKGERTRIAESTITTTGTVTKSIGDFTNVTGGLDHTYTSHKGEFGTFRMRLDSYTLSGNPTYCTDYAYRTQSVGYMEPKSYPYTWDFTDIETYQNADFKDDKGVVTTGTNKMAVETTTGYKQQPADDHFHGVTYIPRNAWESDGSFRVANDGAHNVLFCGGSQLWYGKTIIPETAGLAFTPVNYDGAYNGAMTLNSNGLLFNQSLRDWWLWRIMIPNVDTECTIYVRARKLATSELAGDTYYNVGYYYGDADNKTTKSSFSTAELTATATAREIAVDDESGDVIYAIPAPSQTTNVTLFFQGVEVHKIAVSKDNKHVNKYGWATESRSRVIDPELTAYFSGKNIEHCTVTAVNYKNKSVTLFRNLNLETDKKVLKKSSGGDNNASIIHNIGKEADAADAKAVDILATNDGFHLFVPDIHDYVKNDVVNNEGTYNQKTTYGHAATMKAQLQPGTVSATNTDGTTNFVLTYDVAYVDHGTQGGSNDIGYVGFFRVQSAGVQSPGNQGYLPIQLGPNDYTNQFTLLWADDADGIDATIADNTAIAKDNVFYNINGQKINGVPTQRGIYIINGKKIVVK